MNRLIKIICVLVACLGVFSSCARTEKERSKILKIYNWADYIDEDILDEFPVWYKYNRQNEKYEFPKRKVQKETFELHLKSI